MPIICTKRCLPIGFDRICWKHVGGAVLFGLDVSRLPIGFDRICWKLRPDRSESKIYVSHAYRLASIGFVGNSAFFSWMYPHFSFWLTDRLRSNKSTLKPRPIKALAQPIIPKRSPQLNQRRSLFVSNQFTALLNRNILEATLVRSYLLPGLIIQSFGQLERSASQKPTDSAPFV